MFNKSQNNVTNRAQDLLKIHKESMVTISLVKGDEFFVIRMTKNGISIEWDFDENLQRLKKSTEELEAFLDFIGIKHKRNFNIEKNKVSK